MKKDQEGFHLSMSLAMEFYKLCAEKNLNTLEERTELLRTFVKEKKAKYLRDVGAFIEDKTILKVEQRRKENI